MYDVGGDEQRNYVHSLEYSFASHAYADSSLLSKNGCAKCGCTTCELVSNTQN